jgi:uncharacterized protein (TIGR03066 family)
MTLTAACLCVVFTAAPVPKERADAEKVVGTWKLVKSTNSPDGLTTNLEIDFTLGGKMILRQTDPGMPTRTYEGDYKVEKTELPYTMKYPNGAIKKETLTIKRLTETELHVVDPDGIQEDFVRVKPEKKDEKK